MRDDGEKWWKRSLYKPAYVDSEEFLNYAENYILGHVTIIDEGRPASQEIADTTQSELTSKISQLATAPSSACSPSYATDVTRGARSSAWSNISELQPLNLEQTDRVIPTTPKTCIEL